MACSRRSVFRRLLGRWLLAGDQDPHGTKNVMLSYGYWQRRFGGDRSVIGRTHRRSIRRRARSSASCRAVSASSTTISMFWCRLRSIATNRSLAGFGLSRHRAAQARSDHRPGQRRHRAADAVWMDSWSNGPDMRFRTMEDHAEFPIRSMKRGPRQRGQRSVGRDGHHRSWSC